MDGIVVVFEARVAVAQRAPTFDSIAQIHSFFHAKLVFVVVVTSILCDKIIVYDYV